MNLKIAIVILNWNGKELLKTFLPSVLKHSPRAEIYIADNASSDDSVSFVQNSFPQIKIIQNENNGGYAKGYNEALKLVNADVLCFLNSDVEVTPNWLDPIVETFQSNPKSAILQPKILDYNNKSKFEYAGAAGGYIDRYGYPFCRGRIFDSLENDEGQYDDNAEIFWASGACLFIRASIFKELRGFDENYFAHFEEIDLCWRAFNLGYSCNYVYQSKIYHVGGATLKASSAKKTFLNFRNSLFTITKNANGFIFGIIFTRLILDGIAALKYLLQFKPNHFAAVVKAHFSYYWYLPHLLKVRKSLPQKPNYFKISSIVWFHFVKGNSKFSKIKS